ncbi:MAG: hypothetical protein U0359_23785 [Byssovorax sp.]
MSRAPAALACLWLLSACCPARPTRPPGLPPTPKTVTKENPGGDAADPEGAALGRLLVEPWGWKRDRFDTLRVPLMDWTKWQRVKVWGHPTRASFRFGDEHYGVIGLWYTETDEPNDPASCLARFVGETMAKAEALGVSFGPPTRLTREQRVGAEVRPIEVELVEGTVDTLVSKSSYLGGLAAYTSWPRTCLIEGFAVIADRHRELATRIRERWLNEGIPRLAWEKKLHEAPPPLTR